MASNNGVGCGRGGRGATIIDRLKNLQVSHRPGDDKTETQGASNIVPSGRGALLAALTKIRKPDNTTGPDGDHATSITNLAKPVGRGRSFLLGLVESQTGERKASEPVPCVRPITREKGIAGEMKKALTNHIRLNIKKGIGIYQYEVKFCPNLENRKQRFAALRTEEVESILGNTRSFDGVMLFLPRRVDNQELKCHLTRDNLDVTLKLTLKHANDPEQAVYMYNILLKRIMGIMKLMQVGNNYYSAENAVNVPQHKLSVLPGYVTAVHDYEGGLQLEIDVSHRVLRKQTVLEFMNESDSGRNPNLCQVLDDALLGCVVLTHYNNKTYRIDEIDWDQNPNSTFQLNDGREISYVQYYKEFYGLTITDLSQPLLLHKKTKKELKDKGKTCLIGLIPELCNLTGLTDSMRQDFRVMKDLAKITKLDPMQRQQSFTKFIQDIKKFPAAVELLNQWGIEFAPNCIQVESRVYKPEGIEFGDGNVSAGSRADWSREFSNKTMLVPVNLKNWIVIYSSRNDKVVKAFLKTYCKLASSLGAEVALPQTCVLQVDNLETFGRALRENINRSTQLAMVIFPSPRADRYSAVKKICCVDTPIPSQVINAKTISDERKLRSVTQKIIAQVNCKLGGELWQVKIPLLNTMICGVDVYHDGMNKSQSVIGFVASMSHNFTRYYSKALFQRTGEEMVESLKICLLASIRKFHQLNGKSPDSIIIYRDGVSDGQMAMTLEYEIPQLLSTFQNFSDYSPSLSVIIVQKRINTRIVGLGQNGPENPSPGTVVDHSITRRNQYDFYLVSQHVTQGTVTPTHYVVLYDTSDLTSDKMQKLSYKLTHLYYNWPGTIRVPAPCQYAHRLCYLVGQNIRQNPNELLADRLFYL